MIQREGARIVLSGAITLANVGALLEEGRSLMRDGGVTQVDLRDVTEVDSSLLAALLCWLREAQAAGRALALANVPRDLTTLARLYGVDPLLAERSAPA